MFPLAFNGRNIKTERRRFLSGFSQGFKQVLIFPLQSGDKILGAAELFHPDQT
jgi:hypothetical protein